MTAPTLSAKVAQLTTELLDLRVVISPPKLPCREFERGVGHVMVYPSGRMRVVPREGLGAPETLRLLREARRVRIDLDAHKGHSRGCPFDPRECPLALRRLGRVRALRRALPLTPAIKGRPHRYPVGPSCVQPPAPTASVP
jgi:hypothetical protein